MSGQIHFQAPDYINEVPVSAATPLPVTSPTGTSSNQVQGTASTGSAVVGNPVLVGGSDGTNARAFPLQSQGSVSYGLQVTGPYANGSGLGVVGVTYPVVIGAYDTTSPRTVATANAAAALGNVGTNTMSVEESGRLFLNISGAATNNAMKSGKGFLHTVTINTPVASGVITIYDALTATGTKIATITLPATLLSQGPMTATYDAAFTTGLTIVTTGASMDVTVTYR